MDLSSVPFYGLIRDNHDGGGVSIFEYGDRRKLLLRDDFSRLRYVDELFEKDEGGARALSLLRRTENRLVRGATVSVVQHGRSVGAIDGPKTRGITDIFIDE